MNRNPMKPWETAVYRAQCRTFAKAREIAGDFREVTKGPAPDIPFGLKTLKTIQVWQ